MSPALYQGCRYDFPGLFDIVPDFSLSIIVLLYLLAKGFQIPFRALKLIPTVPKAAALELWGAPSKTGAFQCSLN